MTAEEYMLFARRTRHRELMGMPRGKRCSMYYTAPNLSSLHVCANCEHFIRLVFLKDEGEGPYCYGVCEKYPHPGTEALSGCFSYDTCEGFERKTELDWMPLFIEEYYELAQERRAEEQSESPAKAQPREKKERGQGDGS